MAAQQECEYHKRRQVVLFCIKCTRPLCATCVVGFKCPATQSQQHEFIEVENIPAFLRNQLDSIQLQLSSEQSDLQKCAKCFSHEEESRNVDLSSQVDRVLQSRDEALQVLQQLQTAIRAATTSAVASVLRAGVESDGGNQNEEDVHARSLACRQQSCTVSRLRNLDDASLLKELAFVRNLIRCSAPNPTSPPSPAPAPAEPAQGRHLASSVPHPVPTTRLAITSQMQNVVIQGKQLIQAFEKIFEVSRYRLCLCIFTFKILFEAS